jgi:hypothetical protein
MVDADGVAGYCDSMGGNRKSKQASQFRVRSNYRAWTNGPAAPLGLDLAGIPAVASS